MNRQRMDAGGELLRESRIDHAMAVEPALPSEGRSYDINPEMRLPAWPMSGMARVLVRLVEHFQALRRESIGQLSCDDIFGSHGCFNTAAGVRMQNPA